MKTIEERAYSQYAGDDCPRDCEKCEMRTDCTDVDYVWAFIDGAQSEHEELTRWHDPKKPPTHENEVLVKYICGTGGCEFCIVAYYKGGEWRAPNVMFDEYDTILGWREIHE